LDWSKIKNIFIISFLILDLYLIYGFIKVVESNEYDVKAEPEFSFEALLKTQEIEYITLPKTNVEDFYLTAEPKIFTIEDTKTSILSNQMVTIRGDTQLDSILKEPLAITEKSGQEELNQFIKDNVLYGDQYHFWKRSSDGSTIIYTQQYKGKNLFENQMAQLIFYVNDSKEVYLYTQTFLEDMKELKNPKKIIQPIKAIETLFSKGELPPKSKITEVELGYFTFAPLPDTRQVLNPAWCFTVEGKGKLYVSAFEGDIIVPELNPTTQKKVME
jgi:regulatory protein YycI of two-component signal transduction system YycFG